MENPLESVRQDLLKEYAFGMGWSIWDALNMFFKFETRF